MKTASLIMNAVAVAVTGFMTLAAHGDIVGSDHDFSGTSWAGGEICKPCHTPHFAQDIGYLWAHTLSTQTYTLFDGSTSSPGGVDELDVHSRMCLSCHDGTIALNDFHNGGGTDVFIDEGARVGGGGDLSDDHPIGNTAEYPLAGNSRFHPATQNTFNDDWNINGLRLHDLNGEQVVSCSTCHNPHGVNGVDHMLRFSNAESAVCLTCHIK